MTETSTQNAIVIERVFDAPIDRIWAMWTKPDHFKQWYGPQGFTIPVAQMELTVGGKRVICMEGQTPNGLMTMWTAGEFTEIIPTTRLVYTEGMADENGNIVDTPDFPMTTVTVELSPLGDRTKMTMTHAGVPADSPGASGWQQAFTKLESIL